MPPFILPTIINNYFIVDSILNIKKNSLLLLQSAPLVLALSSKIPTYYYLPPTIPPSLLLSSLVYSNIK